MTRIITPCSALVLLSILLGYVVARMETDSERAANDDNIAEVYRRSEIIRLYADGLKSAAIDAPSLGLWDYYNYSLEKEMIDDSAIVNLTDLELSLTSWATNLTAEAYPPPLFFEDVYNYSGVFQNGGTSLHLTFDWTDCTPPAEFQMPEKFQDYTKNKFKKYEYMRWSYFVNLEWKKSYKNLFKMYADAGKNETYAKKLASENASGHKRCTKNLPAGALFWLSIMTTIGECW